MTARWRKVRTNAELAKVLEADDYGEIVDPAPDEIFYAYGSATVRAYGSATVRAYDSATVDAYGSATVRAYDSATVDATPYVAVHRLSMRSTVNGGVVITPPDLTDPANWLAYYGVHVDDGKTVLFKAVGQDWLSGYGTRYQPGDKPEAPDWQPTNACGQGLHLSPRPHLTLGYYNGSGDARFVACQVDAADLVVIGSQSSADKCKVRSCTVLHECDIDGEPIAAAAEAVAQ
jgi:hypothetical protein